LLVKHIVSSKFEAHQKYPSAPGPTSQMAMFKTYLASPCSVSSKIGRANCFMTS
jgi:hypothetical protein